MNFWGENYEDKKYKKQSIYIDRNLNCFTNNFYIYDSKGNYIGAHYHKLFVFNNDCISKKGFRFIKDKAYPVFEYPESINKKPEILHTEKIKSIMIQDLNGHNFIMDGFLGVDAFNCGGSTFNPNTKKGYIINTLTEALGGKK